MRRPSVLLSFCCLLAATLSTQAATGRVIKVLPTFLDLNGRHTLSPSLYERDAYQARLRLHPERRSGMRFDVQWKVRGHADAPVELRIELRGTAKGDLPSKAGLQTVIRGHGWFSHWSTLRFTGDEYRNFGEVTAWRVSLWEGNRLLGEQTSFLW